jgi:hypothetical protein
MAFLFFADLVHGASFLAKLAGIGRRAGGMDAPSAGLDYWFGLAVHMRRCGGARKS